MPLRIDDDVVLLDEAADAGDFGHAFGLGQREADVQSWSERCSASVHAPSTSTAYW